MSESLFLATDKMQTQKFSPSVAIKFLIDEGKSRNLLTQVNFDGVDDPYFFANDFTNHPPRSTNKCMIDSIEKKFRDASSFTFSTGTGHIAGVTQDGTLIADEDQMFPYEVILVPNRDAFPKDEIVEGQNMLDFFTTWQPATDEAGNVKLALFDVKARYDPDDVSTDDLPSVGTIWLTSDLYRSTFGDERLFFQHETITRDLNKMKLQGDTGAQRRKDWIRHMKDNNQKNTVEKTDLEFFVDMLIANPLEEDNDGAMETVEEGLLGEHECPFAWFLGLV